MVTFQLIKVTFRLVYLSIVLKKVGIRMSHLFSNSGQILYRAKVGRPQKAVHAKSCSDFLLFVPKFWCSQKKKEKGLHLFSC